MSNEIFCININEFSINDINENILKQVTLSKDKSFYLSDFCVTILSKNSVQSILKNNIYKLCYYIANTNLMIFFIGYKKEYLDFFKKNFYEIIEPVLEFNSSDKFVVLNISNKLYSFNIIIENIIDNI
ncbi:hypothetical protein AB837_00339 [bacterium AB1]|nr:hypothetical protein AB837_00339 [bacterium AB1]